MRRAADECNSFPMRRWPAGQHGRTCRSDILKRTSAEFRIIGNNLEACFATNWLAASGCKSAQRSFELSLCDFGSPRTSEHLGLGVLHRDTPNRDSLACDLMEPVRPLVDAY